MGLIKQGDEHYEIDANQCIDCRRLRRYLPDAGNCSAVIVHPETGLCRAVQARFPFL